MKNIIITVFVKTTHSTEEVFTLMKNSIENIDDEKIHDIEVEAGPVWEEPCGCLVCGAEYGATLGEVAHAPSVATLGEVAHSVPETLH